MLWNLLMGKFVPTVGLDFRTAIFSGKIGAPAPTDDATQLAHPLNGKPGVLILGGAHGSLAIARSLGRRGIDVWFATHDHPIAKYSRYTKRAVAWPGPAHPQALDWLLAFASRWKLEGWVLFPGADAELRLLAQNHDALSNVFHAAAPDWSVAQWTHDKRLTQQHAQAVGVATPLSIYPRTVDDLIGWDCAFPVILKPTVHDVPNAFTRAKAWRADDRQALLKRYGDAAALVGPNSIVVQEMIKGGGETQFSCAGVWNKGQPVACLVARRTRQFPLDFGYTSTFVETIDRPKIAQAAQKFLEPLKFSGLVELEFKFDARTNLYKLLDVNARVWSWAAIGAAAGLDFPYLAYRIALGEAVAPSPPAHSAAWIHAARNLVATVQEAARGKLPSPRLLSLPRRPLAYAAFAIDDPLPGLIEIPLSLGRTFVRRLQSLLGMAG
jgi:D-aspartate ligase